MRRFHGDITRPLQQYECNMCAKIFTSKGMLNVHKKSVHEREEFVCDICNSVFTIKSSLDRHKKIKHDDFLYLCHLCAFKAPQKRTVDAHKESMHPEASKGKSHKCSKCDFETTFKFQFIKHTKRHIFQCHICEKSLSNKRSLAFHVFHHSKKIRHKCKFCFFSTFNSLVLRHHMKSSHPVIKSFPCTQCNLKFSSTRKLSSHKASEHPKVRMLKACHSCDFSSYSQSSLIRHSNSHLYRKCEICQQNIKDFPRSVARHAKRHECNICQKVVSVGHAHPKKTEKMCLVCNKIVRSNHNHKENKVLQTYPCEECQKTFAMEGNLRIHMRTHTKEKPFTCSTCNKSFSQTAGLARHKLACADVRDVSCPLCDKKFRSNSDRDKHTSGVHFKLRKFKCDQCPKSFTDGTPLKYHIKAAHGDGSHLVECPSCERKFSDKRHFKRHFSKVHEEVDSYIVDCLVCGKQYADKGGLKNHMDKFHSTMVGNVVLMLDRTN